MNADKSTRQPEADLLRLIDAHMTLRWRDLDAYNHVNNSTFLTYLEEARLTWLANLDGEWMGAQCAPVVAATQLNYRAQLSWPGTIRVELFCERLGNTSLTISHRIVDAARPDNLYCDGNVVLVWIDQRSGKSVALPDVVRRACRVAG
ncbi:MAG: thioesterase family protein [Rudaea sp.]